MSQQQKLEQVLDLLLSEESDQAAELLHQIIVEKARLIYEDIVEEEDDEADASALDEAEDSDDEVGGEADEDFTDEVEDDTDEIESDEENDGEADDEGDTPDFGADEGEGEGSTEDRLEDLESQLADLRAEFDALMGEEMQEPEHADLAADMGDDMGDDMDPEMGMDAEPVDDASMGNELDFGSQEKVVGEVVAQMFERKKSKKLEVAPQAKKTPKGKDGKKVDEETQFLKKVADTGQKGTAKLVGTGKDTPLGAENNRAPFTHAPSKKDYGGGPVKIGSGTGGEYGKYHGDSAKNDTPSDNVGLKQKNVGIKADTTAKYTGGKAAGEGFAKSPLTKKPA
jgi:hypothetical protein